MTMEKQNLVTQRDSKGLYDLLKCSLCGHKQKYYGLDRPSCCPKCGDGIKKIPPVYGAWTSSRKIFEAMDPHCRFCGAKCIITPEEGHPNSRFWVMKRMPDEIMYCCPNGCLEDGTPGKGIQPEAKRTGIKILR